MEKKTAHAAEQDRPDILTRRQEWFNTPPSLLDTENTDTQVATAPKLCLDVSSAGGVSQHAMAN